MAKNTLRVFSRSGFCSGQCLGFVFATVKVAKDGEKPGKKSIPPVSV